MRLFQPLLICMGMGKRVFLAACARETGERVFLAAYFAVW